MTLVPLCALEKGALNRSRQRVATVLLTRCRYDQVPARFTSPVYSQRLKLNARRLERHHSARLGSLLARASQPKLCTLGRGRAGEIARHGAAC